MQGPSKLRGVDRSPPGEGGEDKRLWPAWTDLHWFSNHDPQSACMLYDKVDLLDLPGDLLNSRILESSLVLPAPPPPPPAILPPQVR